MGEPPALRPPLNRSRAEGWSRLHHGLDPADSRLLSVWLRLMWSLASPFVRLRVPPNAITVIGGLSAVAAVPVAPHAAALALVAVAVAADGLDGAVAVLAERATRAGARLDAAADRVADCAFALVIWRCGAPLWLAVVAGGLSLGHETLRVAPRVSSRVRSPVRITVAERPTRVICAGLALVAAAVSPAGWPATVCAAAWAGLALAGLAQLIRPAR